MLIVNAIVNKFSEVSAPYLMKKLKKKRLESKDGDEIEKQACTLDQYEVHRAIFYFIVEYNTLRKSLLLNDQKK